MSESLKGNSFSWEEQWMRVTLLRQILPLPSPIRVLNPLLLSLLNCSHLPKIRGGGSGSHLILPAGPHTMRYLVTTTASRPGLQDSHVFIVGYVDQMQFMRFDSDAVTQRIQARGPWVKQMGPEYLEMEKRNAERYSHRARQNLRFAIQVYNQSDSGE